MVSGLTYHSLDLNNSFDGFIKENQRKFFLRVFIVFLQGPLKVLLNHLNLIDLSVNDFALFFLTNFDL